MRSIRMISDADGELLRAFESERQSKVRDLLMGAIVTDVVFHSGCGIDGHTIDGMTLKKDDKLYRVSIEANQFYEVIETRLVIENNGTEVEKLITMPSPCDTCTKQDCKTRSKPGEWVVRCGKEKS